MGEYEVQVLDSFGKKTILASAIWARSTVRNRHETPSI